MPESARGGGVSAPGGFVCSGGGCLLPGGVLPGGVLPGGVLLEGLLLGVSALGGVCSWGVSKHALRQTPPLNRITDTSKNITLATTSLRPVTRQQGDLKSKAEVTKSLKQGYLSTPKKELISSKILKKQYYT